MGRPPPPPPPQPSTSSTTAAATATPTTTTTTDTGNHHVLHTIRDRFLSKRNPNTSPSSTTNILPITTRHHHLHRTKSHHHHHHHHGRKSLILLSPFRATCFLYFLVVFSVSAFVIVSILIHTTSVSSSMFSSRGRGSGSRSDGRRLVREGLEFGSTLKFVPGWRLKGVVDGNGLDEVRMQAGRVGFRHPRLALVLGNMKEDPQSLVVVTIIKNLQRLGYAIEIYAIENGKAQSVWEEIGGHVSILGTKLYGHVDWSLFDGVIVDSLEAEAVISSLMQEPFHSIPLIWIIQEDTLAKRIPLYQEMGLGHLVSHWRSAFNRANVVVFPDFILPMLYSVLDAGNFFVIPGSPVDVWAAESYMKTHARDQLRADNSINRDDMVVVVVGSSFFYNELSLDYAVAMHTLGPLLLKYAKKAEGSFKFIFLCGNSTDGDALQELTSRLGLLHGSVRHYGLNGDVNSALLMADIVLYGSSQDEQGLPSLIIRAMTFGIPIVAPDIPIMKNYIVDGIHGMIYAKYDPDALLKAFSQLIIEGRLSNLAQTVASSGRLLAKNILASDCLTSYARLLENILSFPSDAMLPILMSRIQQREWEWKLFMGKQGQEDDDLVGVDRRDLSPKETSVVYSLEEELTSLANLANIPENGTDILVPDIPTKSDWDVLREIEISEDNDRIEMEEIEGRTERPPGVWDEIYHTARRSAKLKFEANERDEGELERTGQPVCIYEIYGGAGAWPFLHHGSLYRGLSLSTKGRRSRSDDVDAVSRLPILNDTYYRDLLCEVGGMFSIASKLDNIHMRPWIGFQSWRATGRQAALSVKAERVLEEIIQKESKGDVMYFWATLDRDGVTGGRDGLTFWSFCDILNGGRCRTAFGDAFREMYSLPSHIEALPPMPEDGDHWSALHSWVMPTPSFLEFIMFSRMFVDSLDALQTNSSEIETCLLGSSKIEDRHCYCQIMELLVNVWAYHSSRKMVFIDPHSGLLEEQHPIEKRKGFMWTKYFNLTLLKSMDEDLAEATDDGDYKRERWLWPMTGEVFWPGIYEREREERYRLKMDKKRKMREKMYDRMKSGYKQKPLGG